MRRCVPKDRQSKLVTMATENVVGLPIRPPFYRVAVICDPGYQSAPGEIACEKCPYGFYKEERNEFECEECGRDETTLELGATSEDSCIGGRMLVPSHPL